MEDILLSKTLYHFDYKEQKRRIWGKILDARKENYIIFASYNPEEYKVFEHKKTDVKRWIEEKKIFI